MSTSSLTNPPRKRNLGRFIYEPLLSDLMVLRTNGAAAVLTNESSQAQWSPRGSPQASVLGCKHLPIALDLSHSSWAEENTAKDKTNRLPNMQYSGLYHH